MEGSGCGPSGWWWCGLQRSVARQEVLALHVRTYVPWAHKMWRRVPLARSRPSRPVNDRGCEQEGQQGWTRAGPPKVTTFNALQQSSSCRPTVGTYLFQAKPEAKGLSCRGQSLCAWVTHSEGGNDDEEGAHRGVCEAKAWECLCRTSTPESTPQSSGGY